MEQTDIARLQLEKDTQLHQVKNLSSEKSALESELSMFDIFIRQLMTNQVHTTPAPSSSQPPPGPFRICGSSELTPGLFWIRGFAKPTLGPSGSRGFTVKSSNLPTYEGKQTLDDATAFRSALGRHFKNAASAIGWVAQRAGENKQCYS